MAIEKTEEFFCAAREEWRPIPGFPPYEVSSEGRVRRAEIVRFYFDEKSGKRDKTGKNPKARFRYLTPRSKKDGRPVFELQENFGKENTKRRGTTAARLVAMAFFDLPDARGIRFVDGDPTNVRVSNMRKMAPSFRGWKCGRGVPVRAKSGHKNVELRKDGTIRLRVCIKKRTFAMRVDSIEEALRLRPDFLKQAHKEYNEKFAHIRKI